MKHALELSEGTAHLFLPQTLPGDFQPTWMPKINFPQRDEKTRSVINSTEIHEPPLLIVRPVGNALNKGGKKYISFYLLWFIFCHFCFLTNNIFSPDVMTISK